MGERASHHFDNQVIKEVREGLLAARDIAKEVFGDSMRARDVFITYDALMSALHCEHEEEKETEPKQPWE